MDDIGILSQEEKAKPVDSGENGSRMNFFVNSTALCFIDISSMRTENRARLHTEGG